MTHFTSPKDLSELRNQYKTLVFKHHPDVSGYDSIEVMKLINNEYEKLTKDLARGLKYEDSEIEFSELFRQKIEVLLKLDGILIEIIGNWIWVTGETKKHKDALKEMSFRFAPKKVAWYFKNYKFYKRNKEKDLDEIRSMYGSQVVNGMKKESLQIA